MKSIGKVVSISEGKLVVRADDVVRPGTKVFDESGKFVGTAIDYFGLTKKPYLLVSPKKSPEPYRGKELFA
jgi:rRNA processing protein Gar1